MKYREKNLIKKKKQRIADAPKNSVLYSECCLTDWLNGNQTRILYTHIEPIIRLACVCCCYWSWQCTGKSESLFVSNCFYRAWSERHLLIGWVTIEEQYLLRSSGLVEFLKENIYFRGINRWISWGKCRIFKES